MGPPFDDATAYHKAGHAVAALALGRPVCELSVLPNRKDLGVCEYHKGASRPSEDWLEREALGGITAEARHTGTYAWEHAVRDREYVRSLAVRRASAKLSNWSTGCWPRWTTASARKATSGRWH